MKKYIQLLSIYDDDMIAYVMALIKLSLDAVVLDDVTELDSEGVLSELLFADDLVLMSDTIEGLSIKFLKWKEAFESKSLKVNVGKTKVVVRGGISKDGLSESKVDPCGVYSLRVKVNSDLCVQCGRWIHGRCAGVKRVTAVFK